MNSIYSYDMKKLNTDFEFGSGPMGAVHPYRKKQNDERWVGKYLLTRNFEEFQVIMRGINLNCNHDYPGILCPKTVYINECKPKGFRILVKYPRMKGSLKTIIENQREKLEKSGKSNFFTKDQVVQYLYSILVGLEYLQKKGIAHTNIKPTNILYGDDGRLRLNDIGLVKEFTDTDTGSFLIHKRGPEFYQPPELFMDNKPHHKSEMLKADIWSLGMVMVELCLLNPDNMFPFSPIDQRKERVKQYFEQIKKLYGEDFAGLIDSFLKIEPSERSTAAEIIARMREMYPGVKELGKPLEEETGGQQKKPNVIQLVSEDLQSLFGDSFKIDNKKGFSVRANEYSKVTDEKLDELINELTGKLEERKAEKFEQLSLNFRGCDKITDEGFKKLVIKLGSGLQSLKNLSLALGPRGLDEKCAITDEGLKHLSFNISKNLTELQSLSLDFNGCELLTENGIKQLVTDICENMGRLQELSLEFGLHPTRKDSKQITDEIIEYIASTIASKLKGLKSLSLTFRGYPDITDAGLKMLEKNVCQQIPGLTQLAFKFYRCDKITGEGVKKLADRVREYLRELHHLTFIFSWCEQVSAEDKTQIKDILRMIPKLTL